MSNMFKNSEFNGDISNWNVSFVTDMSYMFYGTENAAPNVTNFKTEKVKNMILIGYYLIIVYN